MAPLHKGSHFVQQEKKVEKLKLTPRLAMAARLAGEGGFAVDVGTDHGRLAVWLLQNGRAGRVAATDINRGPLSAARQTASDFGLEGRIRFELCDGLDFEGAQEADVIVIAGMGGETIQGILGRSPWSLCGPRLVLQPQSKLDELCRWLYASGCGIRHAALAAEGVRLYVALEAGPGRGGGVYAEEYLRADPLLARWLDMRLDAAQRALHGLESAQTPRDTSEQREVCARLCKLRKEL